MCAETKGKNMSMDNHRNGGIINNLSCFKPANMSFWRIQAVKSNFFMQNISKYTNPNCFLSVISGLLLQPPKSPYLRIYGCLLYPGQMC